jgi:hypothetical protein
MAGTIVADTIQADSTSTLVLKNGVANTPPTIQDSAGTQIGTFCRAWVNFNGTLVTNPASMTGVRGSFNVSSILDNGIGDYTINFTTAMPDVNYVAVGNSSTDGTYAGISVNMYTKIVGGNAVVAPTTTALRLTNVQPNVGAIDSSYMAVAIFR